MQPSGDYISQSCMSSDKLTKITRATINRNKTNQLMHPLPNFRGEKVIMSYSLRDHFAQDEYTKRTNITNQRRISKNIIQPKIC